MKHALCYSAPTPVIYNNIVNYVTILLFVVEALLPLLVVGALLYLLYIQLLVQHNGIPVDNANIYEIFEATTQVIQLSKLYNFFCISAGSGAIIVLRDLSSVTSLEYWYSYRKCYIYIVNMCYSHVNQTSI